MGIISDAALKRILSDKTSGSGELLSKINDYLSKKQENVQSIQRLIPKLKKHFQSFENIQKYLLELDKLIRRKKLSPSYFSNSASETKSNNKIFVNALPYFKRHKIILTISNSKTVFGLLTRLQKVNRNLKVIVCESRPKLEGRIMAYSLAEVGIKVQLITESMMSEYVQKSDAVLIGADVILRNGDVVNKIGSKTLAILCKGFKKPFFIAADRSKFSGKNKFVQREEDRKEIWRHAPKNITIRNRYFEIIPKSYITKIFTD
ncbi:MAG: translation initiation factor eIF-2B [Bacteroidetes bacterium]|nr:translation initiation factor eIF-2B [Bacteroidota bacterium]